MKVFGTNKEKIHYYEKKLPIIPMSCNRPSFTDQTVIDKVGIHKLDETNSIIIIHDLLDNEQLDSYLTNAVKIERKSGKSGFGTKPRKERCLTVSGEPYVYSGVAHPTNKYPHYILTAVQTMVSKFNTYVDPSTNSYKKLSHGVDIVYSNEFVRGGSIAAHQDDEEPDWGLVFIFSLGQERWLRVRRLSDKKWFNVKLRHNSLIAMYGETFQQLYTHQVDKLGLNENIGVRLSLNVRFSKGEDNIKDLLKS